MVTFSKPLTAGKSQGNGSQKLKPIISIEHPKSVEEWLKFCQHLQTVITKQNIIDPQSMYAITKSMLHRDALTAFESAKGVNGLQS
eukprot:8247962-Ditylum_brightwellii.AAC.1